MSSFNGSPPTSQISGYSPWIKPPGYDFSSALYSYMSSLIGQPSPRYSGFGAMQGLAQQKNPYINDMTNLAQNFWQMGMPSTMGTALSSLGRFLAPSFVNPIARLQMGSPNYFGAQATPSPNAGVQPQNPFVNLGGQ